MSFKLLIFSLYVFATLYHSVCVVSQLMTVSPFMLLRGLFIASSPKSEIRLYQLYCIPGPVGGILSSYTQERLFWDLDSSVTVLRSNRADVLPGIWLAFALCVNAHGHLFIRKKPKKQVLQKISFLFIKYKYLKYENIWNGAHPSLLTQNLESNFGCLAVQLKGITA